MNNSASDNLQPAVKLSSNSLLQPFIAAIISAFLVLVLTISHASIIFSGPLLVYLPAGIAMAVLSSIAIAVIAGGFSSLNGSIAFTHSVSSSALAVIIASIASDLPFNVTASDRLATIVVTLAIATISTGLFFLFLGVNQLGRLVRFVPIPVIGGFTAAMSLLIVHGAIEVTSGLAPSLAMLNHPMVLGKLAVAAALGGVLFAVSQRNMNAYALPLLIILSLILFHAIAWQFDYSQAELTTLGWLPTLPSGPFPWPPISSDSLANVQWSLVISNGFSIFTMMLVTTMVVLLSISSIELATDQNADLNREMMLIGAANVVAGAFGGMAGCNAVSNSLINIRLGGSHKLSAFMIAFLGVILLTSGSSVLSMIPMPIYGGLLFWGALTLLKRWLYDTFFQLNFGEYSIIVLIVIVTTFIGFIGGLVVGMLAGVVLFALDYSQINVVRSTLSGKDFHSRRDMSQNWHQALDEHGGAITIMRLQGYIFFGTAHKLLEQLTTLMDAQEDTRLRFLLLDFHRTTGLDLAAIMSFIKLERLANQQHVKLILTGLPGDIEQALSRSGFATAEDTPVHQFKNLNDGLAWCEDKLILRFSPTIATQDIYRLEDEILTSRIDPAIAETMMRHMERRDMKPGELLIEQGASSNELYFVESGYLRVIIPQLNEHAIAVNLIGPGSIAGEISFYTDSKRTASVECKKAGVLWVMTRSSLDKMTQKHPKSASAFHHAMARLLAERVATTTRLVQILAD